MPGRKNHKGESVLRVAVAIIGTRQPTADMAGLCRKVSVAFRDIGWELVTGNAKGIDSIARNVWNKICPERVTLVLPWPGYNRDRIHPANVVVVYSGQGKWYKSVRQYHPAFDQLTDYEVKLHARNYGVVELADTVIAFPRNGEESGGTGQGVRVARALGKKLFVLPGDLDTLRNFWRRAYINSCAASLADALADDTLFLSDEVRQKLLALLGGQ